MAIPGSSEVRVGLFAIAAITAAVWASMATTDNPFKGKGYELVARLPTAEGLQPGSSVEMAGVRVGAINEIRIDGTTAIITLGMDPRYHLPADSKVQVSSRGLLGDTVVKVVSGTSENYLSAGGVLGVVEPPPTIAELQAQLGLVAADVQAVTGALRSILDSEETRGSIDAILTNIEGFTEDLSGITKSNKGDLDAVVDNLRLLTEQLNLLVEESRPGVANELESLQDATDTLNRGLERVESIASKIDEGQGTLGLLVNDDRLGTGLTETIEDVGRLVESVNRFQIEVYYRGEFHITHRLPAARFSGKNLVGLRIKPRPDYWYVFEFVDDPRGDYAEETVFIDDGSGLTSVREVRRTDKLQFTFMFAKRYRDLVLRIGIKENTGGVGADLYLFRDRFSISVDVFDFMWASFPNQSGIPNVKLAFDVVPVKNVYFTVGSDDIVNSAVRREFTWFVGGGVWFTDNDIKWVLGGLPTGAL